MSIRGRSKHGTILVGRKVPAVAVATTYTFTGPSSGTVNVASTNFTVTPNGTSTVTVTPATTGAGSFSPATVTFDGTAAAKTFTYTPTSTIGSPHTLSVTNDGGLTNPSSIAYTVSSVSGAIAVTTPVNSHGYRVNGSNQATVAISGTYTGGPTRKDLEASLAGSVYQPLATGSGGNFSGSVTFTVTPFTSNVQGTLTVRFVDAPTIFGTVTDVSIGVVVVIGGQSNAAGQITTYQSYANGSGLKAVAYRAGNSSYTAPGAWGDGNDPLISGFPTGSPWPLLATHLMAYLGVPVIFVETALGGRSLVYSNWYWTKYRPDTGAAGGPTGVPGITDGYAQIQNSITLAATGGVDAFVWYQGESDVDGASILRNVYGQAIGTFADQIGADVTNSPPIAVVQFGHDGGESAVAPAWADAIKLALSDFTRLGGNVLDGMVIVSDFSNALHILTTSEAQKVADRMFALLKSEVFGGTAGAGRGPRAVACQYNSARTTVTVCHDKVLKTGLTLDKTLYSVTGNGSAATISSIAYHGTDTRAVVLTLSGAATLPILVSFAQGGSTAGKVWPLGPDFTLPAGAGTINLPAEPFAGMQAAQEGASTGGSDFLPPQPRVLQSTGSY